MVTDNNIVNNYISLLEILKTHDEKIYAALLRELVKIMANDAEICRVTDHVNREIRQNQYIVLCAACDYEIYVADKAKLIAMVDHDPVYFSPFRQFFERRPDTMCPLCGDEFRKLTTNGYKFVTTEGLIP